MVKINNDEIRKSFEDRFKQSLFPLIKFDRTLRGVYTNENLQNMWEGFYACAELYEAEITQLKSDRTKLVDTLNGLDDMQYDNPNTREDCYNQGVRDSIARFRAVLSEVGEL